MGYVFAMEGDYAVLHPTVPESEPIAVVGHRCQRIANG